MVDIRLVELPNCCRERCNGTIALGIPFETFLSRARRWRYNIRTVPGCSVPPTGGILAALPERWIFDPIGARQCTLLSIDYLLLSFARGASSQCFPVHTWV